MKYSYKTLLIRLSYTSMRRTIFIRDRYFSCDREKMSFLKIGLLKPQFLFECLRQENCRSERITIQEH